VDDTSAARRLRDELEPIATQGWWSPAMRPRLEQLGVGFLEGYAWGRAAALGEPAPSVVVATFGVFEPTWLSRAYERGRSAVSRDEILANRAEGAAEGLAKTLGDRVETAALAEALHTAMADVAATARPLFSALRELPVPATAHGRLWRAAEMYREHRGDSHLAACIAAGLDPVEMNIVTELAVGYRVTEYSSTRGYQSEALEAAAASLTARGWLSEGNLTDDGRAARAAIERATDAGQAEVLDGLGDRIENVITIAASLSDLIVAAGAFPADVRKRAAG
jgi:hypothetical protein